MNSSHYKNTETKILGGGKKIVRKVTIKNGKGYKSITEYQNGKKKYSVRKKIQPNDVENIINGKFVIGLFKECTFCKTRKRK